MADNRRVMMEMVVDNLPNAGTGAINFFDTPPPTPANPEAEPSPPAKSQSDYPDVELSILNSVQQEVASLMIIEHKETHTSLTLHLRGVDINQQYTARAEMTLNNQRLDLVEIPFTLNQAA